MRQRRPDRKLGAHHDEFWAWCERGELRIPQCQGCGKLCWPVSQNCEQCGATGFDWKRMSGRGRVIARATFHQDYYKGVLKTPYDTILVDLEEGLLFISDPHGFGYDDISPDMPVSLVFIDCEDSAGSFRLPVFERS